MGNIKIELLVDDIQKYVCLGELESDSLDSKIIHYGYHVNEDDETLREDVKKAAHRCGATPTEQYVKLTELAKRFYPNKEHIIKINITKN